MKSNALADLSLKRTAKVTWPFPHPGDSTECVFMGNGVTELAKAKYGALWTGMETNMQLPELLPDALEPRGFFNALSRIDAASESDEPVQWYDPPSRKQLERAHDLLALHRPDLGRPSRMFGMIGPCPLRFTIKEWKIAQQLAEAERDRSLEALGRWFELQKDIAALCESGILEVRLRPVEGGEFSDILPKHFWRYENYALRFVTFLMNPDSPFDASPNIQDMQWIFFTKASLRLAVAKLKGGQAEVDGSDVYESELLAHMRKVSRAIGMSAETPPKKVEVVEALQRLWEGEKPLSTPDLNYMASFIRPLASRAGRNKSS